MAELNQWAANFEAVLNDNQGQRLTATLINGLMYHVLTTLNTAQPTAPPQQNVAFVQTKLVDPLTVTQTFGDVTMAAVSLKTALEIGLRDLHEEHWKETEDYRNHTELKPDYGTLQEYEDKGMLQVFVMFPNKQLGQPQAVGNFICYFHRSTHNGELVANEDAIFVKKEWRGKSRSDAFIKFIHQSLADAGVKELRVEVKLTNRVGDMLLRRYGYQHVADRLSKRLDRPLYRALDVERDAA
jgi:GNAT superfamily N-acetyltransferase